MFDGMTALSLMLCVATVGVWLRSYSVAESFKFRRPYYGAFAWSRKSVEHGRLVGTMPSSAYEHVAYRPPYDLAVRARMYRVDSEYK